MKRERIESFMTTRSFWLIAALLAVCTLPVILPGDAPWIEDEPLLLSAAYNFNHTPGRFLGISFPFSISSRGLSGSRGAVYGPAAEWFYQLLLLLSHNLIVLMAIRAGLVTLATAVGLVWLSRAAGLSSRFAVVILLSPWLWFYSRQLWDNSFCIPLSVLALAGYAGFLKSRSPWAMAATTLSLLLLLLIHPMTLAMVLPITLHMAISQRRWLWRLKWLLLAVIAFVGVFAWPYLHNFAASYRRDVPPDLSPWLGWFYPLLGAHHLSALGLSNILGNDWMWRGALPIPYLVIAATWITGLAYLAAWAGMLLAIPRACRVITNKPHCTVLDHVATLALGVWLCQTLLDGFQHVYGLPHYYNGTWIVYAIFTWMTVDAMPRHGLARAAMPAYAASSLLIVGYLLMQIHIDSGVRFRNYGPALGNQQDVVDEVGRFPAGSFIDAEFPQWQQFPNGYQTLQLLRPPTTVIQGQPCRLIIHYRNAFPGDSHIEITAIPLLP